MVELALTHKKGGILTAQSIANRRHIPEKYLVHILLQLKRAGLVHSVRGAQGGYNLAIDPDQINLLQIVEAIDGPVLDPPPVDDGHGKELQALWKGVAGRISGVLRETTLRKMVDTVAPSDMYYI
jgi:Rrf2 family protein